MQERDWRVTVDLTSNEYFDAEGVKESVFALFQSFQSMFDAARVEVEEL